MFKSMKIGFRIALGLGMVIVLMTAMGLFAMNRLGALDKTVNSMVIDRWPKTVECNEIIQVINEMARAMHNALLLTDTGEVKKELQKVTEARNEVTKRIEELAKTIKSEEGKAGLKSIEDSRSRYAQAQNDLIRMIESGMKEQAITALHSTLHPLQADYFKAVSNLVSYQSKQMEKAAGEAEGSYRFSRTMIVIVLGGSLALAIFIIFFVTRSITKPLSEAVAINNKLAEGDLSVTVKVDRSDEVGQLLAAMKNMVDKFKQITNDIDMLSDAAVKGKLATRADVSRHEGDYQKIVQGINDTLDAIIGPLNVSAEYVDRISKGDIPPKITDEYKGDFNEIKNNLNNCIDNINALVADVNTLEQAAVEGKLDTRADAARHQGDFRKIVDGVNNTMSSVVGHLDSMPVPAFIVDRDFGVRYMNAVGASLTGLSQQAVIGTKCYDHFKTPHCRTDKCATGQCMQRGHSVTAETDAHPQGMDLDISYTGVPVKDTEGRIIGALEVATDLTAVKSAARLAKKQADYQAVEVDKLVVNLEKIARGDLSVAPSAAATDEDTREIGENFTKINDGLERTVQAVADVVRDADGLVKAAVEGKLATRADATKHHGDYRKIVEGVNDTLDAVIGPLNVAAEYVDRISKGDVPPPITDIYKGDFNEIKNNLNSCIDAVNALVADVNMLAGATVQGDLATRADATKHQGDFRKIVEGVNNTMSSIVTHLDSMPVPAFIVDRDFGIRYMNAVGASLTGLSQQTVIGTKCYDHFKTPHCRTDKCATGQCMQRGHSVTAETDAHPQGMDLDISYTGVPVKDTDGMIIGALEVATDLTAVKSAARLAKKQADYQAVEVDKLVVNLEKIARGDLSVAPSAAATDEDTCEIGENFTKINDGLERTVQAVANLVRDSYDLAKAAVEGKLATRADATKHHGDYRKIVEGVNDTLDAVIGPLNVAAEYVDRISKGDVPPPITDIYKGDFNEIKNNLNSTVKMMNELLAETDKIILAAANGELDKRADANLFVGGWHKLVAGVNDTITNIVDPLMVTADYVEKVAKGINPPKITTEYKGQYNLIKNNLHMLIDAMEEVTTTAEEIASGNLTVKVKERSPQDKLMQAMADMVASLTEVASNIQTVANQVMTGSQEMSVSSEQLSQGAAEQSASVEEVSASMEQMAANIKQNSDNAQQTEKIALKAATDGRDGGKSVSETVAAMKEIAGKISIIEEIARQTNLLALNAAIEAARAGEHGKGFAVVASEVRKLAERSQTAAAEINKLSASSVQIAERAGEMLARMVPDIQRNADLVQEITAASNEQSSGADQINKAIQQLDQVIQQNASASEEMASTSTELLSQAEQLQNTIAFFKLNGGSAIAKTGIAAGGKPAKSAQKTHAAHLKHAASRKTNGSTQSSGVHLNLSKEVTTEMADDEFERY